MKERPIGFQPVTSQSIIEPITPCPGCPFEDKKDEIMRHCPGFLLMQAGFEITTRISPLTMVAWDAIGMMWQRDAESIGCSGPIYEEGVRTYAFAMAKRRKELFV